MKVVPLGQRVLVKDVPPEEKTAGGIIIPETGKKKTQIATVVAVGSCVEIKEGDNSVKFSLEIGENIIYSPYSGTEISSDGESLRIIDFDDILAIVED